MPHLLQQRPVRAAFKNMLRINCTSKNQKVKRMHSCQGNTDDFKPWLLDVVPKRKFLLKIFGLQYEPALGPAGKKELSGQN
jgi:hypothetical protein